MADWERAEGGAKGYYKAQEVGDEVTLRVTMYGPAMGRNFDGDACPMVVGLVSEYRGSQSFESGDVVKITGSQAQLGSKLMELEPREGDLLLVRYDSNYETAKGDGKAFEVLIQRGGALVKGDLA